MLLEEIDEMEKSGMSEDEIREVIAGMIADLMED